MMKVHLNHSWDLSETAALELQHALASKVIKEDRFNEIKSVAGVDVAYDSRSDQLVAAVVLLNAQTLQIIETAAVTDVVRFPYIPGLFSFRELPAIAKAMAQLSQKPDLVVCDGQGIAHPRRFGLACHLGVMYDVATIGCGKTRLIGEAEEPDTKRGSYQPLLDNGEVIGALLRTQSHVKPLYVSVGHRISLQSACDWVLRLTPKYRLPETTRQADQQVKALLRKNK